MSSLGFLPVTSKTSSTCCLMISRPRVVVLVDPVAEAHQPLVAVLHALEEVGDVVDRLDPIEHPQHGLVGAAVQRAVEGGDAGGDGRVGIDLRGADTAHRVGRAVLLVVGVQDPEHVEGALEPRVGLVLDLRHLEHHREEVAGVGQVVVRIDVRQPQVVPVGERGQRRHLRDQPHRRHVALGARRRCSWRPGRRWTARRRWRAACPSGARRSGSPRRTS